MLSKLLKHEFTATWRVPVALDALLIILGIMAHFVIKGIPLVKDSVGVYVILFSLIAIYYIGIIAANIIAQVYLVMRYYRNLYTSEGYLTFTLPVNTNHIINAKVINGYLWMMLSCICTFASLFIAAFGLVDAVDMPVYELREFANEMSALFGLNDPGFIIILLLTALVSPLSAILGLYSSVTVGQLWQKHKILGAVFCYVGIYIINQIGAQIAFLSSGYFRMLTDSGTDFDAAFSGFYGKILSSMTIFSLVMAVICYTGCILITKKKINLD